MNAIFSFLFRSVSPISSYFLIMGHFLEDIVQRTIWQNICSLFTFVILLNTFFQNDVRLHVVFGCM